jgi:hypothetical protein
VRALLFSKKRLLEFAALSVIESIRKVPEKYLSLARQNSSATIEYTTLDFNPYYMYGQQQHIQSKVYFTEDYVAMLSEDADKLLEKLVKELEYEVINHYPVSKLSSSLPLLPEADEDFPPNQGASKV